MLKHSTWACARVLPVQMYIPPHVAKFPIHHDHPDLTRASRTWDLREELPGDGRGRECDPGCQSMAKPGFFMKSRKENFIYREAAVQSEYLSVDDCSEGQEVE